MTTHQRNALLAIAGLAGTLLMVGTGGYLLLVQQSLEAAQAGRTSFRLLGLDVAHPLVARLVSGFGDNTDGPFASLVRSTLYSKFVVAVTFGALAAVGLVFRRSVRARVVGYFTATTHPLNLAIFRVCLFGFAATMFSFEYLMMFATLPETFLVPPLGMAWLLDLVSVRPEVASWSYGVFLVATLAAAVGFMTRVSAVVAVLVGTYVLGIPNFYGKVDHYNHVLWFMAILAASPAGDTLSVDAVIRSWRTGGRDAPPAPDVRYALPLRIVWLLIGVCYFFPGLWKIADGGLTWVLGDTFRTILHRQWLVVPHFQPPFALDRYPILYRAAAGAAVAFELSFVFLVFLPRLRRLAVAAGLAFHNATGLMMSIWFLPMQVSYTAFVDWSKVFRAVGTRLYRPEATLWYDARHPGARRLVAATRHLDVFQRVRYEPASASSPDSSAPLRYELGDTSARGWTAWWLVLRRVPLAALLAPVWLIARTPRGLGHDDAILPPAVGSAGPALHGRGATRAVAIVGCAMLLVNGWFGGRAIEGGWPFASYPTFAKIRHANVDRLRVTKVDVDGSKTDVDISELIRRLKYQKFGPLVMSIAATEDATARRQKLAVLHALIVATVDDLHAEDEAILSFVTESADPAYRDAGPVDWLLVASLGIGAEP